MKKAGNITPAFKEIDEGDERDQGKEDPPTDIAKKLFELLPSREVGVSNYFPRG